MDLQYLLVVEHALVSIVAVCAAAMFAVELLLVLLVVRFLGIRDVRIWSFWPVDCGVDLRGFPT